MMKKPKFCFFLLCLLVWEHNLMAHFNLVPADIMKKHGMDPVPLGKWSELAGFSKHQPSEVQCPNLLHFRNSWGKVVERSDFRFENFCLSRGYNRRAIIIFFSSASFASLAGFFWYRCYYPHRSRNAFSVSLSK